MNQKALYDRIDAGLFEALTEEAKNHKPRLSRAGYIEWLLQTHPARAAKQDASEEASSLAER